MSAYGTIDVGRFEIESTRANRERAASVSFPDFMFGEEGTRRLQSGARLYFALQHYFAINELLQKGTVPQNWCNLAISTKRFKQNNKVNAVDMPFFLIVLCFVLSNIHSPQNAEILVHSLYKITNTRQR